MTRAEASRIATSELSRRVNESLRVQVERVWFDEWIDEYDGTAHPGEWNNVFVVRMEKPHRCEMAIRRPDGDISGDELGMVVDILVRAVLDERGELK